MWYENIFPYFAPSILLIDTVNWLSENFVAMTEQIIKSGHPNVLKYIVETAALHASKFRCSLLFYCMLLED
jgi:hypothetical protein